MRTAVVKFSVVGLFCIFFVSTRSAAADKTRTIHFPKDRSMGTLYVGKLRTMDPHWWQGWEVVGQAKGDVQVAIGKDVRLDVSTEASKDISPLTAFEPDDIQVITFSFSGASNINDAALVHLAPLRGLKQLGLGSTQVNGSGLAYLSKLTSLETLKINRTNLTDDGLKDIPKIRSLRRLVLDDTLITDAGLAHLRDLDSLELLTLYGTSITGEGFSHLTQNTSLRGIWLNFTDITDDGLAYLAKLKSLETLSLFDTKISNKGLAHLKNLKSLRELNLEGTNVTDSGLDYIGELTSLEKLMLPCGTTDAGLVKLKRLTGMKWLDIGRTQLTGKGLEVLKTFKNLEYLQLPAGIVDKDLIVLKELTSLEELWIQNSPITNKGFSNLGALKSLKKLLLHDGMSDTSDMSMKVTGSGLYYLSPLLNRLTLTNLKLDESCLTSLSRFTQLEDLKISETPLVDEDLANLANLKRLKRLFLRAETVSDGGIAHLSGLTSLEDFCPWVPMTDEGLSYLTNMKKLDRLQIKGDFTDEGLKHLEKLQSLRSLIISTGNDFSPARQQELQKALPLLQYFKVYKNREVKSQPRIGDSAPPFTCKTLEEKGLKLDDYRGKVVLLYFWATWCSPCVASTPALKEFYKKLSRYENFEMISLSLDKDKLMLRQHVRRHYLTWPQVHLGLNSQVAANYGVSAVPAYILIGTDGKVLLSYEHDWNKLKAAVIKALCK